MSSRPVESPTDVPRFIDAILVTAVATAALFVAGFMFTSGVFVGLGVGRFGIDLSSEKTILRGAGPSLVSLLTIAGPLLAYRKDRASQKTSVAEAILWDFPIYVVAAAVVTAAAVSSLPLLLKTALTFGGILAVVGTGAQNMRATSIFETLWDETAYGRMRAGSLFIVLTLILSVALGVVNGAHAGQASVTLVAEDVVLEENQTVRFALRDNGYMYFVQQPSGSGGPTILVVPEGSVRYFVVTPPRDEWLIWLFL